MKRYRKPYRLKKKRLFLRSKGFWLAVLISMAMGGIFYLFFVSSVFRIKEINASGNQKIPTQNIQDIAKEILFSDGNNFFLADESKIENKILNDYPQVAKAEIKLKFPDKLTINIEERQLAAVFCNNYQKDDFSNCFYVDKNGVIFELVAEKESTLPTIQKSDLNDKELKLGENILDAESITKILEINSNLKEKLEITPQVFLIAREDKLNVETLDGWEIYFDLKGDISWQLTKLSAVLEKEIPPEKRRNLEYIDVRFGNLAPFKYKNLPSVEP